MSFGGLSELRTSAYRNEPIAAGISVYGVIMSFREREEWEAVVTSCFAEYGMMTMDVGVVADRRTIY